ncbi:oligosaccharyl transferase subunit ost3/OST6, partial [Cladochytrium tenue]
MASCSSSSARSRPPPLRLAIAAALLLVLVAAVAPGALAFSVDYKVAKLEKEAAGPGPAVLTTKAFTTFTEAPRNYSMFVVLTAMGSQFACVPCKDFASEWDLIARGWARKREVGRAYFGVLDFENGQEVFMKAEDIQRWIQSVSGVEVDVRRPVDYTAYLSYLLIFVSLVSVALAIYRNFSGLLTNKKLWMVASIATIVVFCSGFMWNSIRGAPFTGVRDGRPELFAPGFQNQFVIETQITATVYAVCSLAFIAMVTQAPKVQDPNMQRLAVLAFIGVFLVAYSMLLRMFKYKQPMPRTRKPPPASVRRARAAANGDNARAGAGGGDEDDLRRDWRKGASITAFETWDDVEKGAEDAFHESREKVLLEDEGSDDNDGGLSEEEIMGLDGVESSDDEDLDDEEDEIDQMDEEAAERIGRALNPQGQLSDDEDGKGSDEYDEDTEGWGKKRRAFYLEGSEAGSDDEEALREEEREALQMQRRQLEKFREEDFFETPRLPDSFSARLVADSAAAAGPDGVAPPALRDLSALRDQGPGMAGDDGGVADVAARRAALARMGPEAVESMVKAQAADVVKMLGEMDTRWSELDSILGPVVGWMERPVDDDRPGFEYLKLRYRLLLTYVTNMAFYLAIRANPPNGKDVRRYPVAALLQRLSGLIASLEKKVEGRVEKPHAEDEDQDNKSSSKKKKKKTKGRDQEQEARPTGFVNLLDQIAEIVEERLDADDEYDGDDESDVEPDSDELELAANDGASDDQEEEAERVILVAPHKLSMSSAALATGSNLVAKRRREPEPAPPQPKPARTSSKVSKTAVVVIPELPVLPDTAGKAKKGKKASAAANMVDFDEIDLELADKAARKRSLQFHTTRLDQLSARQTRQAVSGDTDLPQLDKYGRLVHDVDADDGHDASEGGRGPHDKQQTGVDRTALDDVDPALEAAEASAKSAKRKRGGEDDEEKAEEEAKAEKKAKRKEKKAKKAADGGEDAYAENDILGLSSFPAGADDHDDDEYADAGERPKRAATWQMLANKGLTPRRRKEDRNPRVKKRARYERAKKRLRSVRAVAVDRRALPAYAGERTGIKAGLAKSVR